MSNQCVPWLGIVSPPLLQLNKEDSIIEQSVKFVTHMLTRNWYFLDKSCYGVKAREGGVQGQVSVFLYSIITSKWWNIEKGHIYVMPCNAMANYMGNHRVLCHFMETTPRHKKTWQTIEWLCFAMGNSMAKHGTHGWHDALCFATELPWHNMA